jgi:hypothetical protein
VPLTWLGAWEGDPQALAFMGDDFMFQLFGKYRDMANAVKNPCHLNLAACMLKLHRFEEVIAHCTVVRRPPVRSIPKENRPLFMCNQGPSFTRWGFSFVSPPQYFNMRKSHGWMDAGANRG